MIVIKKYVNMFNVGKSGEALIYTSSFNNPIE